MEPYKCTYCQRPIGRNSCRVNCADCPPSSQVTLCIECFSCGVEIGQHKQFHDYQILNSGSITVFDGKNPWTANEIDALLESVEQYSFGNWDDVSDHVVTKTPEECSEHYCTFFVSGNVGKATFSSEASTKGVEDHTIREKGASKAATIPPSLLELSVQEQQEIGYMPLRDDFENEYDSDAESAIGSLSYDYDDEDVDIAYKLLQVDIYRQRLKERERRKTIAKEYGILQDATSAGSKKIKDSKKKLLKDEKDLREKLRLYARFHRHTDHEQMLNNLQREKRMKSRIKELVRYRRNGVTRLSECGQFDTARICREKRKEMNKKLGISTLTNSTSHTKKERESNTSSENSIYVNQAQLCSSMPGFELLSAREKKLCKSIGLVPSTYITIKTCIIKDYLQKRQGVPIKIRYPSQLDKSHRRKILEFLTENGWIGSLPVTNARTATNSPICFAKETFHDSHFVRRNGTERPCL